MQIRTMPLSDLQAAPYNPRRALKKGSKNYERLARSLREFSLVQPLVWNSRTGHVVGGHQRLQILRDDGVTEVEVVEVDLPLEREKALNIALNNSRVGSDWDLDKLTEVLEELNTLPEIDLSLTGFEAADLRDLKLVPEEEFELEDEKHPDAVEVILVVPKAEWSEVQRELDRLMQEHGVQTHVR
ncbi:MAG: ParB N-terminal domain-containing protein [Planctomycetales bacterium]